MNDLVRFHIVSGIEPSPTDLTTVRFLSSMDSLVSLQDVRVSAGFVTEAARISVSTSSFQWC